MCSKTLNIPLPTHNIIRLQLSRNILTLTLNPPLSHNIMRHPLKRNIHLSSHNTNRPLIRRPLPFRSTHSIPLPCIKINIRLFLSNSSRFLPSPLSSLPSPLSSSNRSLPFHPSSSSSSSRSPPSPLN